MPLHILDEKLWFPPVTDALEDGLLAMGGDVSTQRLLLAYKKGIFPWYDGDIPLWWCPNPRFVLFPNELKVSKSMQQLLKRGAFKFTINKAFKQVINHCKNVIRQGQAGTWITDEVEEAFMQLHQSGYAHSAEVWQNGDLAGGLYGVKIKKAFFGESMFSLTPNASKYAFIQYLQQLKNEQVQLIDCQVYTPHLESLGAKMIERKTFLQLIDAYMA